jgi:hypothetical protein
MLYALPRTRVHSDQLKLYCNATKNRSVKTRKYYENNFVLLQPTPVCITDVYGTPWETCEHVTSFQPSSLTNYELKWRLLSHRWNLLH